MSKYPFNPESLINELTDLIHKIRSAYTVAGAVIMYIDRVEFKNSKLVKFEDEVVFYISIPIGWQGYPSKTWNKYGSLMYKSRKELYDRCQEINTLQTKNATLSTKQSPQTLLPKNEN